MSQYYKHIRTAHTAVEEENTKHSKAGEESVETHIVVVEPTSSAVEDCGQYIVVEASDAVIIPEPNVRKEGGDDGGHRGQALQTIEGVKQGIEDGDTNPDGSN